MTRMNTDWEKGFMGNVSRRSFVAGVSIGTLGLAAGRLLADGPPEGAPARKGGNPVLDGWYADPEAVIFGREYWIYPTYSASYEPGNPRSPAISSARSPPSPIGARSG